MSLRQVETMLLIIRYLYLTNMKADAYVLSSEIDWAIVLLGQIRLHVVDVSKCHGLVY